MRFPETMKTIFVKLQLLALASDVSCAGTFTTDLETVADYANHQRYVAADGVVNDYMKATCDHVTAARTFGECGITKTRGEIQAANTHLGKSPKLYGIYGDEGIPKEEAAVLNEARNVKHFIDKLTEARTAKSITDDSNIQSTTSIVYRAMSIYLHKHNAQWIKEAMDEISEQPDAVTTFLNLETFNGLFKCKFVVGNDMLSSVSSCAALSDGLLLAIPTHTSLDPYTTEHLDAALQEAGYGEAIQYLDHLIKALKALSEALQTFDSNILKRLFSLSPTDTSTGDTFQNVFHHITTELRASGSVVVDPRQANLLAITDKLLKAGDTGFSDDCVDIKQDVNAIFDCLMKR